MPKGNEHLKSQIHFDLEVVRDPSNVEHLRKAKSLNEFMQAGRPVVFEGQFAFIRLRNGEFVADSSLFDVKLNYRAPRIVRWGRDWNRSAERGRTREEQMDNARRFSDRTATEEEISVPAGADTEAGIVQVNTTDLAESLQRLIYYGRENFSTYRSLFEQLGIDPETIENWQLENLSKPVLLELLEESRDDVKLLRKVDGIEEYLWGDFIVRVEHNRSSLTEEGVQQNLKLRERTNRVMAANTVLDLHSIGAVTVQGQERQKRFGKVSVWNRGESLGERLRTLAQQGDETSLREAQKWIDQFIEQEFKQHRRGIVDSNPDIMEHRRLLTVQGRLSVTVVSPERNLLMEKDALDYYRQHYISHQGEPIIYLQPKLVDQIPEVLRDYYIGKVKTTWPQSSDSSTDDKLISFYQQEFERSLRGREKTERKDLPKLLKPVAHSRFEMFKPEDQYRNWDVEHPLIFNARLEHMRSLYTQYFIRDMRDNYADRMPTDKGTPQIAWTALFVHAYPDKFNKFYQLMNIFYSRILDNPDLIDESADNADIIKLIKERYDDSYKERGISPPPIHGTVWDSFGSFLNESRQLAAASPVVNNQEILESVPGGIDFNPSNLNIHMHGNSIKIDFSDDFPNMPVGAIEGFIPVIINIAPVINIPLLLGEINHNEEELLSMN